MELQIDIGNNPPIFIQPYLIPHAQRPILDDFIQEQLKKGITELYQNLWNSPLVIVKKKVYTGNKKYILCKL